MAKINSAEGLEIIKKKADRIPVRIKREKWGSIYISDMTALEFIGVLIMWIEQGREIT